jgi:hypothetical protein
MLTAKGTQNSDPLFGTAFYRDVTQGVSMDGLLLKHKFNFAALDTLAYFRTYQKLHKTMPLDETLADLRLLSFSSESGTLSLRIQVVSKAGENVQFVLPFPLA